MYPRPWRYARISLYTGLETACVGPPERADERVSTEEKVSHMGASVPCNTSPTDGGDIRAADVQMKLTDWLRLNRLHILLRLRRTTSGRETLENVWRMERLYIPSNCFPKGRRRRRGREREREGGKEKERSPVSSSSIPRILFVSNVSSFQTEERNNKRRILSSRKIILIPIGVFR